MPAPLPLASKETKPATKEKKKSLNLTIGSLGLSKASHQPSQPGVSELAAKVTTLEHQIETLKSTQQHMASRLERIIYVLQQELIQKSAEERDGDLVLLALAELKQVKDIGFGDIIINETFDLLENAPHFPSSKQPASSK